MARADRYLFLDIDGVLNHHAYVNERLAEAMDAEARITQPDPSKMFDPTAIARVNSLVEAIRAKIVITSSWRGRPGLADWLRARGLKGEIIGETPRFPGRRVERGQEIQHWMDVNRVEPHQIVILDDAEDMLHLSHRLVKTSFYTGILERHVQMAMALFDSQTAT